MALVVIDLGGGEALGFFDGVVPPVKSKVDPILE